MTMSVKTVWRTLSFPFLVVLMCFLSTCSFLLAPPTYSPREIMVNGNSVTIEWDNPEHLAGDERIESQRIYIRSHGSFNWRLLDEINYSETPSYTVRRGSLEPGKYDFGVSIVTSNGIESSIHSSLDSSASPPSGWYIYWVMD